MFWDEATVTVTGKRTTVRMAPPTPETEWKMPEDFPDLRGQGMIAVDVETYDPDLKTRGPGPHRGGYIAGVAVGTEAGFRQYYPVAHQGHPNLDKQKVFGWLGDQLKREGQPKVGANLLYDLQFFKHEGVPVTGPFYDVQVAEPLLDETQLSYSLESIALRRLGEGKRDEKMVKWLTQAYGASNIKGNIYRAPPQVVGPYAESDVDLPLRIFAKQRELLYAEDLWELFLLESRLIPLLLKMRMRGVRVDVGKAETLSAALTQRQDNALGQIKHLTGHEVDIWAGDSITKMFDDSGMDYERTPKGAPSFRKEWLEKQMWEPAKLLVEARRMDKFRGTFVEGYILNGNYNGRIHTQFNQLRSDEGGTVSGRFSSSLPNLQNLPIRDPELGPLIRDIFIPEQGQRWWKIDWSQIEFRLAVHYAAKMHLPGADNVVQRYHNDRTTDYHKFTAEMTGLSRANAKSINFGIVYGLGKEALCNQLGISVERGQEMLDQYHNELPFVKPLHSKAMWHARRKGMIKTLSGRRRRFKLWTKNLNVGGGIWTEAQLLQKYGWDELQYRTDDSGELITGEYRAYVHKALNGILQGGAADIMKTAMVEIDASGVLDELGDPHLTVHDELDGSLPDTPAANEALREVMRIMETCVPLEVPLLADMTVAESWGKTKN
jgi:DNA polymerase I-like protein with 3'-5' exonuclease and polymerase domains